MDNLADHYSTLGVGVVQDSSKKRIISRLTARCLTNQEISQVSGGLFDKVIAEGTYCGVAYSGRAQIILPDDADGENI